MLDGSFDDKWDAYEEGWVQEPNLPVAVHSGVFREEEHEEEQGACKALEQQEKHISKPEETLCPYLV